MPAQGARIVITQPHHDVCWEGAVKILVIGGGVIGLSIAWRAAQRGLDVMLFDPRPGAGASSTAAGMLAPVTELHFEGRELLALNLESAARYPAFAAELAELTGIDVGFRRCGTVAVGWDAADLAAMRQLHAFQRSLGVESALLTSRELRELEPALAAGLPGGLWAENDHQVDNRKLHAALLTAVEQAGGVTVPQRVAAVIHSDGTGSARDRRGDRGRGADQRRRCRPGGRILVPADRRARRRGAGPAGQGPDAAAASRSRHDRPRRPRFGQGQRGLPRPARRTARS